MHYTAEFRTHPPTQAAGTVYFGMDVDDVPAASFRPDRIVTLSGRKSGICGAPWSRSSTQSLWCLFSTILCRRWWNTCRTPCASPRSCSMTSPCAQFCVLRSLRNSWWKCRRSYPIPGCRYEWSRTSTFQFLVVEREFLVFKVFFPDRVQQRRLSRRSLTFPVEVFKVLILDRVRQCLRLFTLQLVRTMTRMSLVKGFFALFPKIKKSAKLASHSGSELLPESSPSTPAAQLGVSVEWVRLRERHAGKTFFWNKRTNSTVLLAPDGVEIVWYGEKDEEGGVWYWHRDTRVSTFDLPPLPPG